MTEKTVQEIGYYTQRLKEVIQIFLEGDVVLLEKNRGIVKRLVDEYRLYKEHPNYNPMLIRTIEKFVLKEELCQTN